MDTHPRLTRLTCKLAVPILALVGAAVWFTWPTANRSETPRSQMAGRPQAPVAAVIDAPFPPPAALTGEAAREQLRKDGQYESLAAAFQAARYAVEKIDPAGEHSRGAQYFAANPGQQLRAWFHADGVELASGLPTREGAEPWSVQVRLRAAGRTAALTETVPRAIRAEGGRVEMSDREGAITEWYENKRDGLEQGFTIAQPPPGVGPLELVLAVVGKMRAVADGVHIADGDGADVVSATGLKAWDADGRTLAARMEVRGSELALVVADAGARYPVTVDPLFANVETRLVQAGAGDAFGGTVALSGDTALVGAGGDDTTAGADAGAIFVFVRNVTTSTWSQQARLTASDGAAGDAFGSSVALSGETALVGAESDFIAAGVDAGSAYVFVRSGTVWSQQAKLTASDGAATDLFGRSVALSGDTALVGAPGDDAPIGGDAGSAYVFVRSGTTWTQQGLKLIANDIAGGDYFGISVALNGGTALVGAWFDDTPGGTDAGSAYVFVRTGTTWTFQQKLTPTDGTGAANANFGFAVALSGETALVGASGGISSAGSAYVFVRTGTTTWTQQGARLTAQMAGGGALGDRFGDSVALSGDTALVGARNNNPGTGANAGSAYVFVRNVTTLTWTFQQKLTASDGAAGDLFGSSVALDGNTVLVSAPLNKNAAVGSGSAYVLVRSNTVWSQQAKLTSSDGAAGDEFGYSVALSGDTALLGARLDDTPSATNAGSVFVFVRSGTFWSQQARLTASDGAAPGLFGTSVALAGDTALVGAPFQLNTPTLTGSAYVFVRTGTNWSKQQKLTPVGGANFDLFGTSVALSGETALVGAPNQESSPASSYPPGSAYVFVRSGATWTQQGPKLTASDGLSWNEFGSSVALSGETALVGAKSTGTSFGFNSYGAAYVFVRSGTTWSEQQKLLSFTSPPFAKLGSSVALTGDTALVGAPGKITIASGVDPQGEAYVFVRNVATSTWSQQAKLTAAGGAAADHFGSSVALNGTTALVGANGADTGAGSAYVFSRTGTSWYQQVRLTAGVDSSASDQFGGSVALSGNTALVGAVLDGTAGTQAGSAYVFLLGDLPTITTQPLSRTVVPNTLVTFSVTATGYGPLSYQWRRNSAPIAGATSSSYAIQVPFFSPFTAFEGTYDVVVSNIGGVVTSAPAVLTVNALSQFSQLFPGAPPAAQGLVVVTLTPAGIASGWRFVGEQVWRASGAAAGGLATGDRTVEFRPTPGYIQPGAETVSVVSGGATVILNREYFESGASGVGALTVTLKPDALAAVGVAQWRFLGEGDPTAPGDATSLTWRNSGATVTGLVPANYLVECKPVAGYTTPPPLNVQVQTAAAATATYFLAEAQTGTPPGVLPFETVATSTGLPYAYVGQLRSNVGVATGFAVRVDLARTGGARVVATAGHVVFDDGARAYAVGLQWLFQRDRGTFEPKPLIPRGAYIFDGYAARRTAEATPGVSSAQSQHLDAAAIYFIEDAARGGFGGYLASDATDNEFLTSPALKTLVGYPVDGIDAAKQGRMHATPPANVPFARVPGTTTVLPPPAPASPYPAGSPFRLYATSGIRSSGGNSGGPLCVQFEGGAYYPAGIFLGGAGQAVVRAIDSQVIDLFRRAEVSGYDGPNNTGGGIIQVNTPAASGAFSLASLTVNITPAGAVNGGAKWKLGSNGTPYNSGAQLTSMTPAAYNLVLMAAPGFITPATTSRTLTAGVLSTINVPYNGVTTHPVSRTVFAFEDATFSVVVSGTPTSYQWRFRPTVGATVLIPGATSSSYTRANADNTTQGEYAVAVTWPDGTILSNFATLTVSPTAQAITFPQPPNRILDDGSFVLDASASSDLPVTFQLLSGPATLTGNTLTPTGLGTVQVRAAQAGNANYSAAANKIRSFDVLGDNLNAWRTRRFTAAELGNPLISGPLADFDGDGVNTLLEFSLNLDPKLGDRVTMTAVTGTRGLPLIRSENISGQQKLTAEFVRRRAAGSPGITYNVELNSVLTNPNGWTTGGTEVVTPIDATWERVKVTDPQPALTTRYGRLKVTMP